MNSTGQKSFSMTHISKAWNDAVDALTKHDHKNFSSRPPEMAEFFITELNRMDRDISDIVTYMYGNYQNALHMGRSVEQEKEDLIYETEQLAGKLALSEESYNNSLMDKAKQQNLYLDEIEVLESSLVTARYYIYLSGMCGFLLGIACLFLVV
jgi:hypothetical protein|tara:strand:- start:255 stop:713 length:459 start_codon:yes stop_codon:yes gene_type:complete